MFVTLAWILACFVVLGYSYEVIAYCAKKGVWIHAHKTTTASAQAVVSHVFIVYNHTFTCVVCNNIAKIFHAKCGQHCII